MKILWLVNVKLPIVYKAQGQKNKTNVAGWLNQISEMILERHDLELVICYPCRARTGEIGNYRNLKYHGIYFNDKKLRNGTLEEKKYMPVLKKILNNEKPDVIHIHGTEFQYAYFMTLAAEETRMINRVTISIQGLVKYYAEHYLFDLPRRVVYGKTVKEFVQNSGVYKGYKSYIRRGEFECNAIKKVKYVVGRTNWDKGCTYLINPDAEYLFANETLRHNFYSDVWTYLNCMPHTIFISQASYPIKGFHLLLKAIEGVKKIYSDIQVRVAGVNISTDTVVKGTTYALYVQSLIRKYNLSENVKFLGPQTAEQMKKEMLRANVFISASTIENSPNSLGEAMILGVPCISSDVGGVADLLVHNEEGYIYPLNETYMLEYYILDVFNNIDKATKMGLKARKHALSTHAVGKNFERLLEIYNYITEKEERH